MRNIQSLGAGGHDELSKSDPLLHMWRVRLPPPGVESPHVIRRVDEKTPLGCMWKVNLGLKTISGRKQEKQRCRDIKRSVPMEL